MRLDNSVSKTSHIFHESDLLFGKRPLGGDIKVWIIMMNELIRITPAHIASEEGSVSQFLLDNTKENVQILALLLSYTYYSLSMQCMYYIVALILSLTAGIKSLILL